MLDRNRFLPHLNSIKPTDLNLSVGDIACVWRLSPMHVDPVRGPCAWEEATELYPTDPLTLMNVCRFDRYDIFIIADVSRGQHFFNVKVLSSKYTGHWLKLGCYGRVLDMKQECYVKRID